MEKEFITAVLIISILAVGTALWAADRDYGIFGHYISGGGYIISSCWPLSFDINPDGTYKIPTDFVCDEGAWVNISKTEGFDVYCDAYYRLVNISYTESGTNREIVEAKGYEFCQDSQIVSSPASCGDMVCGEGESEVTCWVDCGPIQSWERMYQESLKRPDLMTYLEPEGVFNYNLPSVESLAKELEATKPSTPLIAITTLTRMISTKITYVVGGVGGNAQCGENSDVILGRGTGNCVDYSTVMIAVLRRGFDIEGVGRVRIPARQIAGCLSGFQSWYATEYPAFDPAGLLGDVIGHSWLEVWVGGNRWIMADPTTDTALAKSWWGYHKVAEVTGEQMCFVPIEDRAFCEVYATTSGD